MGCRGSEVRIFSPRPQSSQAGQACSGRLFCRMQAPRQRAQGPKRESTPRTSPTSGTRPNGYPPPENQQSRQVLSGIVFACGYSHGPVNQWKVELMSAQPRSSMPGSGVVSELAFARAQRNTVLIVDDLFSSRLLLAEIVRQIDGKLNLELFDTPVARAGVRPQQPRRHRPHRLQAARIRRHRTRQAIARAAALRGRADRRDHRGGRPQDPLRRAGGRCHRLPDQATRRARDPRALRQSARTAPAQDRAVRSGPSAAVPGRQVCSGDPRARTGNAVQAREGRRVPRQDHRQSPDADGQVFGTDRRAPGAWQ